MTRFGVAVGAELPMVRSAQTLEELGFDYLAVGEHLAFHGPASSAFVALAVAAGATTRIRLVSTIALLPLYPAAMVAKMAAELSRLSDGRFELGLGMGGEHPPEFAACGIPVRERVARMEEGLTVVTALLSEQHVTFDGRFATLADITLDPQPDRPPRIWLGGRKQRAMERAGRFADVWMPYLFTPQQYAASVATVREAGRAAGRDPRSIGTALFAWTCVGRDQEKAVERAAAILSGIYGADMRAAAARYVVAGTPAACARQVAEFVAAGVEDIIFSTLADSPEAHEEMWYLLASEVMPSCVSLLPDAAEACRSNV